MLRFRNSRRHEDQTTLPMMPIKTGYEDINVKMLPSKCSLLFLGQPSYKNFDEEKVTSGRF